MEDEEVLLTCSCYCTHSLVTSSSSPYLTHWLLVDCSYLDHRWHNRTITTLAVNNHMNSLDRKWEFHLVYYNLAFLKKMIGSSILQSGIYCQGLQHRLYKRISCSPMHSIFRSHYGTIELVLALAALQCLSCLSASPVGLCTLLQYTKSSNKKAPNLSICSEHSAQLQYISEESQ